MEEKQDKNWLEWIVLGISSLLVLSVIGLLVYNAVTVPDTPPIIKVSLGQLEQQEGYFVVPLVAVKYLVKSNAVFCSNQSEGFIQSGS